MEEFLQRLDAVDVPDNYQSRFLDIMDSFGDGSLGDLDVLEHTIALGKILSHHWVTGMVSNTRKTTTKPARPPPKVKVTIPYNGTTLTKNNLGYRNSLDDLPPKVRRYLFAYIYTLLG